MEGEANFEGGTLTKILQSQMLESVECITSPTATTSTNIQNKSTTTPEIERRGDGFKRNETLEHTNGLTNVDTASVF